MFDLRPRRLGGWLNSFPAAENKQRNRRRIYFSVLFYIFLYLGAFYIIISQCFLYLYFYILVFFYISIFYVSVLFLPQLTKLFFHVKNWSTIFARHLDNVNSTKTAIPCGGDRTVEQFKLLNRLQNSAFFKKYFW